MSVHCYSSHADKARKYVQETLPDILAAAERAPGSARFDNWFHHHVSPGAVQQRLQQLHEAARNGRYVGEVDQYGDDSNCDDVQEAAQTLAIGGDCEDWAAVLLAACGRIGLGCYLVTSGEAHDNFLHICVAVIDNGRAWLLDPKGDQLGAPFNVRSESYSVRRYWTRGRGGVAHEVFMHQAVAV